jgi:hypothetical protein
VTDSASPRGWSDATARTCADNSRLAPGRARVERIDPSKGGACRKVHSFKAPIWSRKPRLPTFPRRVSDARLDDLQCPVADPWVLADPTGATI